MPQVGSVPLVEALRYVRHRLDVLNGMRLDGPLSAEQQRSYRLLCAYEGELLEALDEERAARGQGDIDLGCPLLPGRPSAGPPVVTDREDHQAGGSS